MRQDVKDLANHLLDEIAVKMNKDLMMQDIKDFHEKFGLIMPPNAKPGLLEFKELYEFRVKFMAEELNEFVEAHEAGDLPGAFDALIDLTYVVLGTAYLMALPFDKGWDEVHKANMNKVRADNESQSKRGTRYDVIKPDGWMPPNLQKVLDKHNAKNMVEVHEGPTQD